ncbi:unnamed protein product [Rotaria magnacalcarata]|uniref:Uncharacterized protein n=2 Tax=Rotaria magnacalcarata TaxID=392030 RepID=A0A820G6H1_9BILA|nr:unnamed protein product [Rotaria magnacalcarata]
MDLANFVINNVLCYFQSMKDVVPKDNIVGICSVFYSLKDITEAKDLIYNLLGETPIRRRNESKTKNELNDIYDAFTNLSIDKSQTLPKFVAHGFNAFPPSSGFEIISKHILSLIDEIAALKTEVSELKNCREEQQKGMENCVDVKEDLADIKKLILMQPEIIKESNKAANTSYAAVVNRQNRKQNVTNTINRGPRQNVPNQNGRRESVTPNAVPGSVDPPVESSTLERTHQAQAIGDGVQNVGSQNVPEEVQNENGNSENAWHTVHRYRRRKEIAGIRKVTEESSVGLRGAPRYFYAFLGGCDRTVTEQIIQDYCKNDIKINIVECSAMETKSTIRKCFKIVVALSDKEKILSSESWPENIFVRRFYMKPTASGTSDNL